MRIGQIQASFSAAQTGIEDSVELTVQKTEEEESENLILPPMSTMVDHIGAWSKRFQRNILREISVQPIIANAPTLGPFNTYGAVVAGISLEKQNYQLDSPYIKDAPIRQQQATILKAKHPETQIFWKESKGIFEAGISGYASVPLAATPAAMSLYANLGFKENQILYYKIARPSVIKAGKSEEENQDVLEYNFPLPTNVNSARQLPIGTEVEVTGVGELGINAGISFGNTLAAGALVVYSAGLAASGSISRTAEYTLSVTALDGEGKVRVTIKKANEIGSAFTIMLLAKMLSPINVPVVPPWGSGAIDYLVANRVTRPINNLYNFYSPFSIGTALSYAQKNSVICSFDIDLNKPQTHVVFNNLVSLSPLQAYEASKNLDSGVSCMKWNEVDNKRGETLDVSIFGESLFSRNDMLSSQEGQLTKENGHTVLYDSSLYRRKANNIFLGTSEIAWEGMKSEGEGDEKYNFYHFKYTWNQRPQYRGQAKRFFQLGVALGCEMLPAEKRAEIEIANKIELNVDIYFNKIGVEKIWEASEDEVAEAFLRGIEKLEPGLEGFPVLKPSEREEVVKTFARVSEDSLLNQFLGMLPCSGRPEAERNYNARYHRSLRTDSMWYEKARKFARLVCRYAKNSTHGKYEQLFSALGKSEVFSYIESIVALTLLAGRENVLVHKLQAQSKNALVEAKDDGQLFHPRDEVNQLLVRAV